MFRSKLMIPALTVCIFASQAILTAAYAATPGHATTAIKLVKLHVANKSSAPMKLQVGEEAISIEPGKSIDLNVAVGTRIINVDATAKHAAGEVLAQVTTALSGATLQIS